MQLIPSLGKHVRAVVMVKQRVDVPHKRKTGTDAECKNICDKCSPAHDLEVPYDRWVLVIKRYIWEIHLGAYVHARLNAPPPTGSSRRLLHLLSILPHAINRNESQGYANCRQFLRL